MAENILGSMPVQKLVLMDSGDFNPTTLGSIQTTGVILVDKNGNLDTNGSAPFKMQGSFTVGGTATITPSPDWVISDSVKGQWYLTVFGSAPVAVSGATGYSYTFLLADADKVPSFVPAGPLPIVITGSKVAGSIDFTYRTLPAASTVAVGTQRNITDWPGGVRAVYSDGVDWMPVNNTPVKRPVGVRAFFGMPCSISANSQGYNTANNLMGFTVNKVASSVQVFFENLRLNSSNGGHQPGEYPITEYTTSVTPAGGAITSGYVNGQRNAEIAPGASVMQDVMPITLNAGQLHQIAAHVKYATAPANHVFSNARGDWQGTTYLNYNPIDRNRKGTDSGDGTMINTAPGTLLASGGALVPSTQIIGVAPYEPTLIIVGDSNRSWSTSVGMFLPTVNAGVDGSSLAATVNEFTAANYRFRNLKTLGITHAFITQMGGDVTAGKTLAQIQASMQEIAIYLIDRGVIPIFTTSLPKTTNATNTTPVANWATVLQPAAQWVRDNNGCGGVHPVTGLPLAYGYYDSFARVGNPATGLWRTDMGVADGAQTDDGIHMVGAVHTWMQTDFLTKYRQLFK